MGNKILALGRITLKEGIKDRSLLGIFIFALLCGIAVLIFPNFFARDIGAVCIDTALSSVTFSGLLVVFFTGVGLINKDIDKKTIYIPLSRPFNRWEYVIGKYLGIVALVIIACIAVASICLISTLICKHNNTNYFPPGFTCYEYWTGVGMCIEMLAILVAVLFLFSAIASQGLTTTILTIATYLIGSNLNSVLATIKNSSGNLNIGKSLKFTVVTAKYIFPNLSMFDFKLQISHGLKIQSSSIQTSFIYGLIYIALTISLSCLLYRNREFS